MYPAVLIVDDEPPIIESLEGILSDDGFEVIHAFNGYEALKKMETIFPDIVLLDIWMPGMDGIETLREIKKRFPNIPVVMITGHGSIETAVEATKSGAYDFLEKPLSIDKVMVTINNALNFRKLEEENQYLRKKTIEKHSITGTSAAVRQLYAQIQTASPSGASILITGEHGTGKELVARTIHQFSSRPDKPFIIIDCAAVPEHTIESELFGHEKGAFDQAVCKKMGKFELASGGTLFLDEIGEMDLPTQGRILRALESRSFQRIGSSRPLQVDVRIIAATNKDLEQEIAAGRFRQDLFFRINVIPIHVPSLRDRREDIPQLATTFLSSMAPRSPGSAKSISPEAMEALMAYSWPGNVRELKNLMERLCIMVHTDRIALADLPHPYHPGFSFDSACERRWLFSLTNLDDARKAFEQEFIRRKVQQADGDIPAVARALGTHVRVIRENMP